MRIKFFALLAFSGLFLNMAGAVSAQTKTNIQTNAQTNQTEQLAALLPASDGILTLNVQRLLNEALPQILSSRQPMLTEMNAKIDELRDKTGLDARQFEQIAIGVAMKQISAKEVDLEPVFLARGKYSANALIALGKLAANGKYREEKFGSRTVYVFTGNGMVASNKPSTKNSWLDKAIDRMFSNLTKEIAVTALDGNTLAFGSLVRVREVFESKSPINNEVLNLVNRKLNAVVSFGAKLPNGLSSFVNMDNDELGRTLDSIRQMSGAVEVADGNTAVFIAAKTLKADQAQSLKETLDGLQMLGKAFLGGGKTEDKKVYGRMIDNARIAQTGSEVTLDLQVPQSDINILLTGIK